MKFPLGMAYFRRYMGNDLKASKFCGAFLQFTVTNSRVSNFGDHHTPPKKTKKTMELTTTNPLSSKNPIQNIPVQGLTMVYSPSPTSKEPFNVATINGVMPSNALLRVFRLTGSRTHTYMMLSQC